MEPTWFEWMVWVTTLGAIIVPVSLTFHLWQRDKRTAEFREQDRATSEFIRQLDDISGDKFALVKFSALPEFLDAFNGAVPLGKLVDAELEYGKSAEKSVDLRIDARWMIQSWRGDKEYRADSTELAYARSDFNLAAEDNPALTPEEIVKAEEFILQDKRIHAWLRCTRLSVIRIRMRRIVRWIRKKARLDAEWNTNNMFTTGNELAFPKPQDTPYPL